MKSKGIEIAEKNKNTSKIKTNNSSEKRNLM